MTPCSRNFKWWSIKRSTIGILLAFFLTLVSVNAGQTDKEVLTNASIIKMVQARLPNDVIISSIQQSDSDFKLDPSSLIALKEGGVADDVLRAMSAKSQSAPVSKTPVAAPSAAAPQASQPATPPIALRDVRKIFVEKMPDDLDQYIRAEITKKFKGKVVVVLRPEDADALMVGVGEHKTGVGSAVTGRWLGLHDTATGAVSLIDRNGTVALWSSEAGDRSIWWGAVKRGGPRKVADRLVNNLKKAMGM